MSPPQAVSLDCTCEMCGLWLPSSLSQFLLSLHLLVQIGKHLLLLLSFQKTHYYFSPFELAILKRVYVYDFSLSLLSETIFCVKYLGHRCFERKKIHLQLFATCLIGGGNNVKYETAWKFQGCCQVRKHVMKAIERLLKVLFNNKTYITSLNLDPMLSF